LTRFSHAQSRSNSPTKALNVQVHRQSDSRSDGPHRPPLASATLSNPVFSQSGHSRRHQSESISPTSFGEAFEFQLPTTQRSSQSSTRTNDTISPSNYSTSPTKGKGNSPTRHSAPQANYSAQILSFNSLLGRVMGLRHDLESALNQHTRSRSLGSWAQDSHNSPSTQIYTTVSKFYDTVEPYLSLQQSIVGSLSSQKLYELQTMLCLVVNAAATVVEMVASFTDQNTKSSYVDGGLSQHLSLMQTFSALEYQIRRCERSLRVTMDVLQVARARSTSRSDQSMHGISVGDFCSSDIEPASVAALGRDASRLRAELSRRVEALKRPVLG
jgi:hypothetical protein